MVTLPYTYVKSITAVELGDNMDHQPKILDSSPVLNPNIPMPQQGVDLSHSDIIDDSGNTASPLLDVIESNLAAELAPPSLESHPSDGVSVPDVAVAKLRQHQVPHQHFTGKDSNSNGAQAAPPSYYLSFSNHFRYTRLDQMLVFLLSTVVAFTAFVIQYELGPEMPHSGIGLMRPGWAHHRNEGWERKELAG